MLLVRTVLVAISFGVGLFCCAYDFDGHFAGSALREDAGTSPSRDASTTDGKSCEKPVDRYTAAITNPRAHFSLDEQTENFASKGKEPEPAIRGANVAPVPFGATGSGAQRLSQGTIDLGNRFGELGGGDGIPTVAIELWFRPRTAAAQTIFSKKSDGAGLQGFQVVIAEDGTVRFERNRATAITVGTTARASAGRWHHLVVERFDGTPGIGTPTKLVPTIQIVLDGEATAADDAIGTSFVKTPAAFLIGPFDGDIDEVAVYDRWLAVTPDVQAHINAAASVDCATTTSTSTKLCFGPEAVGRCETKVASFVESCPTGQICLTDSCVPDPCAAP